MTRHPIRVEFAGATLLGVLDGGVAWVAMKPIVEGMGLSWPRQYQKMIDDEIMGPTIAEKGMVAEDGKRREMICLPEELLQGWLFTVNPKKVKPEIRDVVIRYKRECYAALHRAFTKGVSDRVVAIDSKRALGKVVADILNDVLIEAGKEPKRHHFMNEHRLCNMALNGQFAGIDESTLSEADLWKLAEIRRRDAVLIAKGLTYQERKAALIEFAKGLSQKSLPKAA